ncbi:glutamine amidotransferase class-i family protein [Seiridium cupressi]
MKVLIVKNYSTPHGWGQQMVDSLSDHINRHQSTAEIEICNAVDGQSIKHPTNYNLVVLTGGTFDLTSAVCSWASGVLDAIRQIAKEDSSTKLLGICWGHQAVHHALGGVKSIQLTQDGSKFFAHNFTFQALHKFHKRRVVTPAPEFLPLAYGNEISISQSSKIITFQGHPELTAQISQALVDADDGSYHATAVDLSPGIAAAHDGDMVWTRIMEWSLMTTAVALPTRTNTTYVGPENGHLVIVGGNLQSAGIWQKIIELAGGPDAPFVVVPTAGGEPTYNDSLPSAASLRENGARNVTVLHTYDPAVADTDEFVAPLKEANGICFDGGRQWRLVDAYAGTKAESAFQGVLDRGGVISGSSAGASIQGSFLARGDTANNQVMVGDHTVGFGYLKNAAIDQHVLVRNRHFDMFDILKVYPELLGVAIDENTALIVHKNEAQVFSGTYVLIYDKGFWSREELSELKNLPPPETWALWLATKTAISEHNPPEAPLRVPLMLKIRGFGHFLRICSRPETGNLARNADTATKPGCEYSDFVGTMHVNWTGPARE